MYKYTQFSTDLVKEENLLQKGTHFYNKITQSYTYLCNILPPSAKYRYITLEIKETYQGH